MEKSNFDISYYLLRSRRLKNGHAPIIMTVTINGQVDEARINRALPLDLWDQRAKKCKGKSREAIEINDYISALNTKAREAHKELLMYGAYISPTAILQKTFNEEDKVTLLDDMMHKIEWMNELEKAGKIKKVTINRYTNCYRAVKKTIKNHYKKEDITYPEITTEFIKKLEKYLTLEKENPICKNTLVRYMKCLKRFINEALQEGLIKRDPFIGTKYVQPKVIPIFLTKSELKRIETKNFGMERLDLVKDLFLFSCYTGLAFIDAKQLSPNDIFEDNERVLWIRKNRKKLFDNPADTVANVPLIPQAIQILEKYRNHPKAIKSNTCLPLYCNQVMNRYLKEIADCCEINKKLTTHVARHTFGTTITLLNKVSLPNVSKMMGHSSIRMTEHYARVMDQSLKEDMFKVAEKMAL